MHAAICMKSIMRHASLALKFDVVRFNEVMFFSLTIPNYCNVENTETNVEY